MPALIPDQPDIMVPTTAMIVGPPEHRDVLVDFSDVIGGLLSHKGTTCKAFDLWTQCHKPALRSAACGGQWTQSRLAAVRGWEIEDSQCQLCRESVGTLQHRLACKCIVPAGGWHDPPPAAGRLLEALTVDRSTLLATRGLLVVKVRVPRIIKTESLQWIWPMPDDAHGDVVWFIDGSMFDETKRFGRSISFAIVATSAEGRVIAIANGSPPEHIADAAGAELWAFYMVLGLSPCAPKVVFVCKGIPA